MIADLQFPFAGTLIWTAALFSLCVMLVVLMGNVTEVPLSPEENGTVETAQFIALVITSIIAITAFFKAESDLLKLAALVLACIACAAFIRETQSCSPGQAIGFCLPRAAKRIVSVLATAAAIGGAIAYRNALKTNFRNLITIATLWPAAVLLGLNFLADTFESFDERQDVLFGINHGFQYLEEFTELFGIVLILAIAFHFYAKAKANPA